MVAGTATLPEPDALPGEKMPPPPNPLVVQPDKAISAATNATRIVMNVTRFQSCRAIEDLALR
jgi:hypothetical protein